MILFVLDLRGVCVCVQVFRLHVCQCTRYIPGACRGQKVLDPQDLELKKTVSCYVGTRSQT